MLAGEAGGVRLAAHDGSNALYLVWADRNADTRTAEQDSFFAFSAGHGLAHREHEDAVINPPRPVCAEVLAGVNLLYEPALQRLFKLECGVIGTNCDHPDPLVLCSCLDLDHRCDKQAESGNETDKHRCDQTFRGC